MFRVGFSRRLSGVACIRGGVFSVIVRTAPNGAKGVWPVAWRSDCGEIDGDAWDAGLTRILQEVYSCLLDA